MIVTSKLERACTNNSNNLIVHQVLSPKIKYVLHLAPL